MSKESDVTYGGRGPTVLGITWSETGLATILILLRTKNASIRPPRPNSVIGFSGIYRLRWDFVWVIVAYILALASQVALTVSVYYGLGNHQSLISHDNLVQLHIWSWAAQVMSILDLIFSRIAVASFLLLIQEGTRHWSRYLLWLIGFAQPIIYIVSTGLIFNQCTPVASLWDFTIPGAKCDGVQASAKSGYAESAIGAFCDFFLAAYPIFLIHKLQNMKRSTKIGVCLVMGGGVIAGIAAITKGIEIRKNIDNFQDTTYPTGKMIICVFTEMWFVIIFGSIPTLRKVFAQFSQDITNALSHWKMERRARDNRLEDWASVG